MKAERQKTYKTLQRGQVSPFLSLDHVDGCYLVQGSSKYDIIVLQIIDLIYGF